ncbi:MAG TPA: sulfate/molybdate ABC transporter ATP-binding protein [Leptolyngbyaceae cyanobacterium M33_DOE_097]|uniref:ABC-type quaternary amine transporter n=1 Tax=Oscillatoriales cyanobacterium SpSt-418 TaxID=2282169 RepID=A0A7C3KHJ9_9CYAN|nr:sulfate/molybdate ABC transporter ATP-binding protein [Leptolyngbyaceae cyanobacterium M33_DOE_097]
MGISVQAVSKQFGSFRAIDNVSLDIKTGSLVALLGPSGSGKSTLLRMIAGLETPDTGQIYLTGEEATYRKVQERQIGFVFQHYALFKHLTVRQNVAFALEIRKVPKKRIRDRVEELINLVQLTGLGDRYPSQLSGGQRQRVALARALAVQPRVLLLDEPFGALDAKVRKELRIWLRNLHHEVNVTTVFVTHDQEEAMEVSDEIVVMNQGRVEQVGTPAEIYDNPASSFVMSFIGPVNVLPPVPGIIPGNSKLLEKNITLQHSSDRFSPANDSVRVFWRPQDVLVQFHPEEGAVPAQVERVIHLGWEIQVELALESGQQVTAHLSREAFEPLQLKPKQSVYVKPKHVKVFSDAPAIAR